MFKLLDGREYVYQWDLNCKLIVDNETIRQVHFCNRLEDEALVVEVKNGIADIPNLILQNSFSCRVFAYDGNHTLYEQQLTIKPRSKPSDYAYTETEIIAWQTIVDKVDNRLAEIDSTEQGIEQSEDIRISNESTRQANEEVRQTNETNRINTFETFINKANEDIAEAVANAVEGPQGPQGEVGPQGPIGETGPQGEQGIQGPKGDKGDKGDTGLTGPQGLQGIQGIQGPKGDKGDTGPIGPQGPKGDKGDQGEIGPVGPQGEIGPQGEKGDSTPLYQHNIVITIPDRPSAKICLEVLTNSSTPITTKESLISVLDEQYGQGTFIPAVGQIFESALSAVEWIDTTEDGFICAYTNNTELKVTYTTFNVTDTPHQLTVGGGSGGDIDLTNYYTKDETYSKTEVDNVISSSGVVIGFDNSRDSDLGDYKEAIYTIPGDDNRYDVGYATVAIGYNSQAETGVVIGHDLRARIPYTSIDGEKVLTAFDTLIAIGDGDSHYCKYTDENNQSTSFIYSTPLMYVPRYSVDGAARPLYVDGKEMASKEYVQQLIGDIENGTY